MPAGAKKEGTPFPIEHLRHAARRDAENGGDGWRSTREVADWCGLRLERARVLLERLHADQRIECAVDAGHYLWRIPPALQSSGAANG